MTTLAAVDRWRVPGWLKLVSVALTVVLGAGALYAGAAKGVQEIGTGHIRQWWQVEGWPDAERRIDEKIARHQDRSDVEYQRQLGELQQELREVKAIAQRNQETLNKMLDVMLEDRKRER